MPTRITRENIVRARRLRARPSDTEGLLWWRLRDLNRRGYHFRRQVPFRGYVLDFADHSARLAVEVDGSQHGEAARLKHDAVRDHVLAVEGYLVLRFSTLEIFGELDRMVESILRASDGRRTPTPKIAKRFLDLPTWGR